MISSVVSPLLQIKEYGRVPPLALRSILPVLVSEGEPILQRVSVATVEAVITPLIMNKVLSWYDNEWGFSCRVKDLIHYIALKGL